MVLPKVMPFLVLCCERDPKTMSILRVLRVVKFWRLGQRLKISLGGSEAVLKLWRKPVSLSRDPSMADSSRNYFKCNAVLCNIRAERWFLSVYKQKNTIKQRFGLEQKKRK